MIPVTLYHNTNAMIQHVPDSPYMPERPERIVAIEATLKGAPVRRVLKEYIKDPTRGMPELSIQMSSTWNRCRIVEVQEPLEEETIRKEYGSAFVNQAIRKETTSSDIYWSDGSWTAARIAAAAAVTAAQAALARGESAFCIIRPPGHHCFNVPSGFCILNNVVLAAREVLRAGKRVAILDWDYHFGDGTAKALRKEENAMFVSFHAARTADGSPTYPANTRENLKGVGLLQKTHGRSFNVQWRTDDADDAAMAYAFENVVIPALQTFRPDVLLVSAGFDAVRGDTLAGMEITPAAFGFMARRLRDALPTDVPVVAVLEGGYDTLLLAECVDHTVRGMLGDAAYTWAHWEHDHVRNDHKEVVDDVFDLLCDLKVLVADHV